MLLFSYGANTPAQLAVTLGRKVSTEGAFVDDYARVFRGYSRRWGGGVATLEPRAGARTYGHIARVTRADLRQLDVREDVPLSYRRVKLLVRNGPSFVDAWVYLANSDEAAAPSRAYLEAVAKTHRTGYPRR